MNIPDSDRQETGTTGSEFDDAFKLDGAEDEDENMEDPEVNNDSESGEGGSADERKNVKKVCS